jgi:hypothetical protein
MGKPEGRILLETPRRRWEDNNKIDIRALDWGMDWIDLAQDRNMRGFCECGNEASDSIKCGEISDYMRIC